MTRTPVGRTQQCSEQDARVALRQAKALVNFANTIFQR
jgi:hypothetical protein